MAPLPSPVADLIDPRHGQPGRLGDLLTGDATLESLADQAAQLGVGIVECRPTTIRNDRASFGVRSQLTLKRIPVNRNRVMGVSPNDTASQQRNLAGAAAVAIAAAPTAMAEPAAVQQPPGPWGPPPPFPPPVPWGW